MLCLGHHSLQHSVFCVCVCGGGLIATFCIKLPLLGYVDEAYIQLLYYMWRENNNITASSKIKVANDKA